MSAKKTKIFLHLLGPAVFIYILTQIDFGFLKEKLLKVNIYFLILSVVFIAVQIALRGLKWRTLLTGLGINLNKSDAINLYWLGTFIGTATPGRLGELVKVYFLKEKGYDAFRSFFSVFFDRLTDVLTLLFLGFFIFLFFIKGIGSYIIIVGLLSVLFLIFVFFLLDNRSFLHKRFSKLVEKLFSIDLEKYNKFSFLKLWQGIKGLKKTQIIIFFIYLIFSWLFYFASRYMISLALELELSFLEVSMISVLTAVATMLPISMAGIGTRDAAVIYLFGLFSLNKETALLFSLLILSLELLAISFGLIRLFPPITRNQKSERCWIN